MKWTIRRKLLVAIVPIILLTVGVMAYLSYNRSSNNIMSLQEERTMVIVQKTLQDLEVWLNDRKGQAEIYSNADVFINACLGENLETAKQKLAVYHSNAPYLESMFVARPDGTVFIDSLGGKMAGQKIGQVPQFQANLDKARQGETWVGALGHSLATNKPVIMLTAPIMRDNQLIGIIGTPIEALYLSKQFISNVKVGETGYIYVLESDGTFLAHPKEENILNKGLGDTDYGKAMLAQNEGSLHYTFEGVDRIAYFKTLAGLNWLVAAGINKKEIMEPVNNMAYLMVVVGLVSMIFLSVMLAVMTTMTVSKPIRTTTDMLSDIAKGEGDLTVRLDVVSNDEVGELAENFNQFVEKLQVSIQQVAKNTAVLQESASSLSAVSSQLSSSAEEMTNQSSAVASAAEQITANVDGVSGATVKMSENVGTIAAASEEMSSSVNSVAAAVEEMTASIQEVSKNCIRASQIANDASGKATGTSDLMNHLETAAKEIGKVVEVINDIADQTNLLALNATIEAASAGEAGKGFAVVANEVKELAKQTAQATDEITKQVEGIQNKTLDAVNAIRQISEIIQEINNITTTIASAVEEQTVTTNEISRSVAGAAEGAGDVSKNIQHLRVNIENQVVRGVKEAATGVTEVSKNIQGVNIAAQHTAQGATSTDQVAKQIIDMSDELQKVVGQFRV
ncbi:MAG: methyl-accepting chemotaxis protein [Myxococcales bacterium]|nr:methyl-accepting chemotaxis protein [Myxococcales bacterium]